MRNTGNAGLWSPLSASHSEGSGDDGLKMSWSMTATASTGAASSSALRSSQFWRLTIRNRPSRRLLRANWGHREESWGGKVIP